MLASFNHCRRRNAESRQIPQEFAARLKFVLLIFLLFFNFTCTRQAMSQFGMNFIRVINFSNIKMSFVFP